LDLPTGSPSYNPPLAERGVFQNSHGAEGGEIQCRLKTEDQFGDVAAHGRPLLKAMAGEAVSEVEAFQFRPFSKDGVMVKGVHGIKAGPTSYHLQGVEGRDKLGQLRPEEVGESLVIRGKAETHRIISIDLPRRIRLPVSVLK
jgi:hypothetical protein